jgi:hypothetical protein
VKITRFNLQIFVEELERLHDEIPDVQSAAESWLKHQEEREKYGWQDQYATAASRMALEDRLTEIRQRLALVYDFMSDRGLVNFEPTQMEASENGREGHDVGGSSESTEQPTEPEKPAGVNKLVRLLQERNQERDRREANEDSLGKPGVQNPLPEEPGIR